ncbi:hypothetical protein ACNKHX_06115 [Shigella flexneri]
MEFPHHGGLWFLLLLVMLIALVQTLRGKIDQHRWVLTPRSGVCRCRWIAIQLVVDDRVSSSAVGDTGTSYRHTPRTPL